LQQGKLLSFSSYDESFCFKVLYQPNPNILKNLINIVHEKLSKRNLFNLQKLDFMYATSKISSYQSLEHFAKQVIFLMNLYTNYFKVKTSEKISFEATSKFRKFHDFFNFSFGKS